MVVKPFYEKRECVFVVFREPHRLLGALFEIACECCFEERGGIAQKVDMDVERLLAHADEEGNRGNLVESIRRHHLYNMLRRLVVDVLALDRCHVRRRR